MDLRDTTPDLEEALRLEALERQQITDTPRDEAFDGILRDTCTALEAPVGAIGFLESERLWIKSAQGMAWRETARDISFCSHTLRCDELLVVEDANRDPRFAENPHVIESGLRFYAGAPLTTRQGFRIGTLWIADHRPRKLDGGDRDFLGDMAAIVVGELELRRRQGTDILTGLYTRRFFQEVAGRELIKLRREAGPLTAAFIAADQFQRIQDRLGQSAARAVLKALGPVCRRALRGGDLLGRHDKELVAILPGATLTQAGQVLERLRQNISAMAIPEVPDLRVTVSVGAAQLAPEDLTLDDLLARAGQALYRAKGAGSNRVALAA